jgi:exodeoxyribonuclease V beta subunit
VTTPDTFYISDGPHFVEASAGTGKTTYIVRTAVRMLLGDPLMPRVGRPDRLLAVTFTRDATAELKERLREQILRIAAIMAGDAVRADEVWIAELLSGGGDGVRQRMDGLTDALDRLSVSTLHGFCTGVLEEFPLECGVAPGLRFVEDTSRYLDDAAADEWRSRTWSGDDATHGHDVEQVKGRVRMMRAAIGARRPTRAETEAHCAAAEHQRLAAMEVVASQFDEGELLRYVARVDWSRYRSGETKGRTAADVQVLAADVAAFRADGVVRVPQGWTSAEIREVVKPKARGSALAFSFLAACDAVAAADDRVHEIAQQLLALDVLHRMEDAMHRDHVAGFDDVIAFVERAVTAESTGPTLRRTIGARYDVVLIDEFQDTDWAQWNIFHTLFAARPLILVGDPKQSIYGFRNADITAYQHARSIVASRPGRVLSLSVNYRSDAPLVEAVCALFTDAPEPFKQSEESLRFESVRANHAGVRLHDPRGRPLTIWELPAGTQEQVTRHAIAHTASEVRRLLDTATVPGEGHRRVQPRDIAILIPQHHLAPKLLHALRREGVAAVAVSSGDITRSAMWFDLVSLIAAIEDPSDAGLTRGALATPLGGYTALRIRALAVDEAAWRRIVDRIARARHQWMRRGSTPSVLGLLNEWGAIERLAQLDDGERRLTDLRHIAELMQQAERDGATTPTQLLDWMRRFAEEESRSDARQLQLESDRDAVTVATVFAAKGLEWPIVFCPFLWVTSRARARPVRVARFADGSRRIVFGEEPVPDELPEDAPEAEAMRLAYVALTRAKWRTYVCTTAAEESPEAGDHFDPRSLSPVNYLLRRQPDGPRGFAAARPDLVVVDPAPAREADALGSAERPLVVNLEARPLPFDASQLRSWSVTSYSAVTKPLKQLQGVDEPDRLDDAEATESEATLDAALPSGANTGDAVHQLFETFDYRQVHDAVVLDAAIVEVLQRFSLPAVGATPAARAAAVDVVRRMARATLEQPIPGCPVPLCEVPRERSLREWTFHMPMSDFAVDRFAAALAAHGPSWIADDYARRLARVSEDAISGFLKGVIDLVVEIEGRWWIVDWKTNTLGTTIAAYGDSGRRRTMMQEHFVVQYHVYVVALHRYLRWRLGDAYDYERDFGGVGYAFLRGLAAGEPTWFVDRPSLALVLALDAVIGGAL